MKKLGFGMMRLPLLYPGNGRNVDMWQVRAMAEMFMDNGFTYFDTAYLYHNFFSEIVVSQCLVPFFPRDSYTVADKMPTMFLKEAKQMPEIFERQLRKCNLDYFDYYMMHDVNSSNYDSKIVPFGGFEFIAERKKEGKVREIGFSFHDGAELLDRVLTEHPEVDFVQLQINYLDWDDEGVQSRLCYETAVKHGKKVIVMEPVKGGTLAKVPEPVEYVFKNADPDASVASWAIRYAASLPNVMVVLSGMSNMEQMVDNISYMKDFKPLTDSERETVAKAVKVLRGAAEIPCTGCNYCVDAGCPMNIPIPKYFTLYNNEKLLGNIGFSVHEEYYWNLAENCGKASECLRCGNCEGVCPQHIHVIDNLVKVKDLFEK